VQAPDRAIRSNEFDRFCLAKPVKLIPLLSLARWLSATQVANREIQPIGIFFYFY
jgi:hypothetical protein